MSNLIVANTLDQHVSLFAEAGACKPPPLGSGTSEFLWPDHTRRDKLNDTANKGKISQPCTP